jgi:hypothetical protein
MTYAITAQDVTEGLEGTFSANEIAAYIALADTADDCMAGKGVPGVFGQRLKVLFVRHMLTLATGAGSGAVTSVSSASGASKSHAAREANSSGFGDALKDLDRWGCVYNLLRAGKPAVIFRSVG